MTPTNPFSRKFQRITPQRWAIYSAASLLAALIYHFLVVTWGRISLACVVLLLAVCTTQYLVHSRSTLQFSHCLVLSICMLLLGPVSNLISGYLFSESAAIPTIQPPAVHFALSFIFMSDMEWLRLRFDEHDNSAVYADLTNFPCGYNIDAYIDPPPNGAREYTPSSLLGVFLRSFRGLPPDLLLTGALGASSYILNSAVLWALHPQRLHDNEVTTAWGYDIFTSSKEFWPSMLSGVLMRPVRLLIALGFAWVGEVWAAFWRKRKAGQEV
ncbi:hypothetical protein P153DRAFT_386366, partial [Dothidotthia symphoricarpi CBS 119687]